jgi:hypothetical protein
LTEKVFIFISGLVESPKIVIQMQFALMIILNAIQWLKIKPNQNLIKSAEKLLGDTQCNCIACR